MMMESPLQLACLGSAVDSRSTGGRPGRYAAGGESSSGRSDVFGSRAPCVGLREKGEQRQQAGWEGCDAWRAVQRRPGAAGCRSLEDAGATHWICTFFHAGVQSQVTENRAWIPVELITNVLKRCFVSAS